MQGPGRGPTIFGVLYAALHKRLFLGLEAVTFQSHDNNFTGCAKVTPQGMNFEQTNLNFVVAKNKFYSYMLFQAFAQVLII